jgi:hypothetical protein
VKDKIGGIVGRKMHNNASQKETALETLSVNGMISLASFSREK